MAVSPTSNGTKRTRGSTKTFPLTPFEDALPLAQAIHDHGVDGELRRMKAFDRLGKSPESSMSRQLVTDSGRYGLTTGSYGAEYLRLTEEGKQATNTSGSESERKRVTFELSVKRIEPFNTLYERLRGKKLPAMDVIIDQLTSVPSEDRAKCASVFVRNVVYLGLIKNQAGAERIIGIDEVLESQGGTTPAVEPSRQHEQVVVPAKEKGQAGRAIEAPPEPNVHIDINIHIDQTASAEQIEQVFASMARHLYGRTAIA
jgi:hypothetical protein